MGTGYPPRHAVSELVPARRRRQQASSSTSTTTAPAPLVPNRETDDKQRADPPTDPRRELVARGMCSMGHVIDPIPEQPVPLEQRDPWDLAALIGGLAQVDELGRCRVCVHEAAVLENALRRARRGRRISS